MTRPYAPPHSRAYGHMNFFFGFKKFQNFGLIGPAFPPSMTWPLVEDFFAASLRIFHPSMHSFISHPRKSTPFFNSATLTHSLTISFSLITYSLPKTCALTSLLNHKYPPSLIYFLTYSLLIYLLTY